MGFYKTIDHLIVWGNNGEHFFNYGYCEENSIILCFYHRHRISLSFVGTLFNRHCLLFETGQLQTDFSNLYCFLPSNTDRNESIGQYMNSANLTPIAIPCKAFEVEDNIALDPSELDISCEERKWITNAIIKMLKKIANISNSSIAKNSDGLLSKGPAEVEV